MENLALLALLFVVSVLAIVIGAAYFIDGIADRNDSGDTR